MYTSVTLISLEKKGTSMGCAFETVFEVLVFLAAFQILIRIGIHAAFYLYEMYVGSWLKLNIEPQSVGKWAVITGPTSRLGKAYAEELARRGMNIVLVNRSHENFQILKNSIENNHGVETEIIVVECNDSTQTNFEVVREKLKGKDIGILVNCAAIGYEEPQHFCDVTEEFIRTVLNTNVKLYMMMCRIVLEYMVVRQKGIVLNIVSTPDLNALPYMSLFGASLKAVENFTQSLLIEYQKSAIVVQLVRAFYIAPDPSGTDLPPIVVPTAKRFVRSQLRRIGLVSETHGYWFHSLQGMILTMLEEYNLLWLVESYSLGNVLRRKKWSS